MAYARRKRVTNTQFCFHIGNILLAVVFYNKMISLKIIEIIIFDVYILTLQK